MGFLETMRAPEGGVVPLNTEVPLTVMFVGTGTIMAGCGATMEFLVGDPVSEAPDHDVMYTPGARRRCLEKKLTIPRAIDELREHTSTMP
jgi:hypothetical protein